MVVFIRMTPFHRSSRRIFAIFILNPIYIDLESSLGKGAVRFWNNCFESDELRNVLRQISTVVKGLAGVGSMM